MTTPIVFACKKVSDDETLLRIIRILVEHGADLESENKYGETPLYTVAENGLRSCIVYLLDVGVNVYIKNHCGYHILSSIHESVGGSILKRFINRKNANESTNWGVTPLMIAARRNDVELVKHVLSFSIDTNALDKDKNTALIIACKSRSCLEVVRLLVENGANVNIKNRFNDDALCIASNVQTDEVIDYLLDNGANLNTKACGGGSPLVIACRYGKGLSTIMRMINMGANVNDCDYHQNTPLMGACLWARLDLVHLLVEHGAKHSVNIDNWTPISLAYNVKNYPLTTKAQRGDYETVVKYLFENGIYDVSNKTTRENEVYEYLGLSRK